MHEREGNIERKHEGDLEVVNDHKWSLKSSARLRAMLWLRLTQRA